MKYSLAHSEQLSRNQTPATVCHLSHKIRNQASYITLSSFTLRAALERTLPQRHLEDLLKIERTVDELQRNLKTLLDLIDNDLSRMRSTSQRASASSRFIERPERKSQSESSLNPQFKPSSSRE